MLVLTRKTNQDIVIGENVVVRVLQTRTGGVKLGIVAPSGVGIRRGELAPQKDDARGVGLRLVAESCEDSVGDGGKQAI